MTSIVAVDIGGTHARFALAGVAGGRVQHLSDPVTLKTAEYASFQTAWDAFAATRTTPLPRAAAIAIACPIRDDVLHLTNNSWIIRPALVASQLRVDCHIVINDFEAVGHAVAQAEAAQLEHVCGPDMPLPRRGITTIVGPGTGLGVGQVFRNGDSYHVVACEGGHVDFAPLDTIEDAVLAHLRKKYRRVSVERIVSGPGLAELYEAFAAREGRTVPPRTDAELWQSAFQGTDRIAAAALDRFCMCLGAVAGDYALTHGPTAVVIAGGVGLRLRDHLPHSGFPARFTDKGRFETLMRSTPVKLITHPQPGLFGAAAAFAREYTS